MSSASATARWKLGIVTDEISEDLERALGFLDEYSLKSCELRGLWQQNVMDLSRVQLDRAKRLIREHGLQVTAITSPIFKCDLPEMPVYESGGDTFGASSTDADSERLLLHSFRLASFFGTRTVRIFSYWRVPEPEKAYPHVRNRLVQAAQLAHENGILLVLENEHSCNIGTGQELGKILRDINSPNLRGNWDPGNAAMLGEVPYPDGYQYVRGLFAHLHVKDVRRDFHTGSLDWAPVGGGFIDWKGQFAALRRDGFQDPISLETHYRRPDGDKLASSRESLLGLVKVLQEVS